MKGTFFYLVLESAELNSCVTVTDTTNRIPPQLQVNGPVQALFKDKIPDEKDSFIAK